MLLAAVLCLCACAALADTETVDGVTYTYTTDGMSATITKVPDTTSGAVTIPSTLGGLPVKQIAEQAFYFRDQITSLVIPSSVTVIGRAAFYLCTALESVEIQGVLYSFERAFGSCSSLKSVKLPEGLEVINSNAFYKCTALEQINIPSSVKIIQSYAFYGCTSLKTVALPEGLETLESYAFQGSGLTSVSIPASVKTIGDSAFYDCSALEQVSIAQGVETISSRAFQFCSALKEITLPDSIKTISSHAFFCCTSLEKIEIPSQVKVLFENVFNGCSSLKSVTLPDGLTQLDMNALAGCPLDNLVIPASVKKIGNTAFWGAKSLIFEAAQPPELEIFWAGPTGNVEEVYVPHGSVDAYKAAVGAYFAQEKVLCVKHGEICPVPDTDPLPKTGDDSRLALWMMTLALACGAFVVLRKRAYHH